jgi:hypothetical protein
MKSDYDHVGSIRGPDLVTELLQHGRSNATGADE